MIIVLVKVVRLIIWGPGGAEVFRTREAELGASDSILVVRKTTFFYKKNLCIDESPTCTSHQNWVPAQLA